RRATRVEPGRARPLRAKTARPARSTAAARSLERLCNPFIRSSIDKAIVHRQHARRRADGESPEWVGRCRAAVRSQWPAPATVTPLKVARRLAIGELRLCPTRTWPPTTAQEVPGVSPRAIAVSASTASDADGASQTTRSAGASTAIVPVPAARRKARALLPVANAITTSGGRSPSEAISQTLLITPRGITPVPVGVSLAT